MRKAATSSHAIIIGLDNFVGLQSARILSRHRIAVIGCAEDSTHYCCRTKSVEKVITLPENEQQCIDSLIALGQGLPCKGVVFPCTDHYVFMVSRFREELKPFFHIALPESDVLDILFNKEHFAEFCLHEELPIPKTFLLYQRDDLIKAVRQLTFPCIVKPSERTRAWWEVAPAKVCKFYSADELLASYDRLSKGADVLIVQDCIPGDDAMLYSCNCYFNKKNKAVVTFIAKKIRQWPAEAGYTSLGVECRNDEVLNISLTVLNKVPFHGLGYLEIKKNADNGKYYLIETNIGRPTGRSSLAEACGVELLYTMYCDVLGLPLPKNTEQSYIGVKWIHLSWDIKSALFYYRRGELTAYEWWKSIVGKKTFAILSFSDPGPFLFAVWSAVKRMIKKD